jgi:hypothetical protein
MVTHTLAIETAVVTHKVSSERVDNRRHGATSTESACTRDGVSINDKCTALLE